MEGDETLRREMEEEFPILKKATEDVPDLTPEELAIQKSREEYEEMIEGVNNLTKRRSVDARDSTPMDVMRDEAIFEDQQRSYKEGDED